VQDSKEGGGREAWRKSTLRVDPLAVFCSGLSVVVGALKKIISCDWEIILK